MAIYHCSIKIISRSSGRSAVASAAYRSGERLYNDETGITHDFKRKGGVVFTEILLPDNAPKRFTDRQILWNEVQKVEKRSDAQLAREVEVALPSELTREEQISCVRAFIKENFVDKGMIADWALHDKGDGNPHAHIMLTVRGIDAEQGWMQKQRCVFANGRDALGRAIYDPTKPSYDPKDKDNTSKFRIPVLDENGHQKTRTRKGKGTELLWEKISIPENNWNDHSMAEVWRSSWAENCNRFLDDEHKIDHRSFERAGSFLEPTVHEGVTARQMEARGITSERCEMNREIRARNRWMKEMKKVAGEITRLIAEKARNIFERFKKLGRSAGNAEGTGRHAGHPGEAAERDRKRELGEETLTGTAGRIDAIKRAADETDREIERTDQRIAELGRAIKEKEAARNERIRKLKERRADSNAGRHAGSDRIPAGKDRETDKTELRSTRDDITAFLRQLETEERASEEERDRRFLERADREDERSRSDPEEKFGAGDAELRDEYVCPPNKERNRRKVRTR